MITRDDIKELTLMGKDQVAKAIIDEIMNR